MKIDKEKFYKLVLIAISIIISVVIVVNKDQLASLERYGYVGVFFLSILGNATVVIPAPVVLTAFVGGGIFNPYIIGVVIAIGATIGELTGYMAGYGGKTFVEKNKRYQQIEAWVNKRGFLTIFTLAVIPNPLFDLAGICAGITKYPIWKFLIATSLGKIIKFVTIALVGAYIL